VGSATRAAASSARSALAGLPGTTDITTAEELFAAGRLIGDSVQLRAALVDPSADSANKRSIVRSVFSDLSAATRELLGDVVSSRWSTDDDLLAGVEELGLRIIAASSNAPIEAELFIFGTAVSADPELELAVGSKLGSGEAKAALVSAILKDASPQTQAIVRQLVLQPRGRRIAEQLRHAASIVADEAGLIIATVTTASPLGAVQLKRLAEALAGSYGRAIRINHVINPSLLGGVRVQIGDDVIDGSVASRLNALRLQLAG
jgi:F-type H+-transporting ATPase subunit delta